MMEIKITPRKPDEVGGYLMMPLVAKGRPGWKMVKCRNVGRRAGIDRGRR